MLEIKSRKKQPHNILLQYMELRCNHTPKYKIEFSCHRTGNYTIELCEDCRKQEPDEFLIREAVLDGQKMATSQKVE